jgi:hypothetical protein
MKRAPNVLKEKAHTDVTRIISELFIVLTNFVFDVGFLGVQAIVIK